jgi:hypothetical protein
MHGRYNGEVLEILLQPVTAMTPLPVHEEGKGAMVADCRIILQNGRG